MIESPDTPTRPVEIDHEFRDEIRSDKTAKIVQSQNFGHASTGAQIGAWHWGSSDPWETTSTSYTTVNDGTGIDLDQINPTVAPTRNEIGGLDVSAGAYIVEIQVFGRDVDLTASFYKHDTSEMVPPDPPTATGTASIGDSWAWASMFVVLEGGWNKDTDHLVRLEALHADSGGAKAEIVSIVIDEIRHENLRSIIADNAHYVYGSEWIGKYGQSDFIASWDADGAAETLTSSGSNRPLMSRDDPATGVHSATFDGVNDYLITSSFFVAAYDGFILGCASNETDTSVYTWPLYVERTDGTGSIQLRTPSNQVAAFIEDDSGSFLGGGVSHTASGWEDLIMWYDGDGNLYLFIDGEEVGAWTGSVNLTTWTGRVWLGRRNDGFGDYDGELAMPVFLKGSFTRQQVEHYMQWRRSQHGIF